MSNTSIPRILWSCVKDGPREQESDIPWLISLLVHWQLWAWIAAWCVPFVLGIYALQATSPFIAVLVTGTAAALISPWAMKVSAKYEIEKNY